jgi:hypothetical protein
MYFCFTYIGHFLLRQSDVLSYGHHVFLLYVHRSFFVTAIWHFILRTSCIFALRTSVIFCSGHPVIFVPDFRFFNYGHPDLIRMTGGRNGHLQLMSVKKEADEKGLPRHFLKFVTLIFTLGKGYNTLPKMKIQGSQISSNDSENQIPHLRKPSIKLYKISLVFENSLSLVKIHGS